MNPKIPFPHSTRQLPKKFLAVAVASLLAVTGAFAQSEFGVTPDMQKKIDEIPKNILETMEKNLPTEAPAKPAKPRKLLVFVGSKGYYHDSIPVCATALKKMGEKLKTWETTITDDENVFTAENLGKFDGIFMVSTVGNHPANEANRPAFIEYIKSGHGLMGTHAAADCNHPWGEYVDMIGGAFAQHPFFQIGVRNEDPDNPINAAFGGKGFAWDDEMYVYKQLSEKNPYGFTREKCHVLLSIDVDKTKQWLSGLKDKPPRTDGEYPIAWIKDYGKGRVFYCSMGHNRTDFSNSYMLKHYLAGVQFALGDLKADTTPSAKLPAGRKMGEAPMWDNKAESLVNK
jgi:type 1 glutamine amidotransferase